MRHLEQQPDEAPLDVRLTRAALKKGEGESSTEAQYVRALAWLETQRATAAGDAETSAVELAVDTLGARLHHLQHPQRSTP